MKSKRNPWTARRVHLWVAVILALPLTLMALSGLLIGQRSVMNLRVPMNWMGSETPPERLPVMAYVQTSDGTIWIGNAQGLSAVRGTQVETIGQFNGQEVIGLAVLGDRPVPMVATRMAIWTQGNGQWEAVRRGRVRQLSSLPDGSVLGIAGGRGEYADGKPLFTRNGSDWQPFGPLMKANQQLPVLENPKVELHQFMRALHSGAFFVGKGPGEVIWSQAMGWVLSLLSLTGLWMWVKRERERRRTVSAPSAPSAPQAMPDLSATSASGV